MVSLAVTFTTTGAIVAFLWVIAASGSNTSIVHDAPTDVPFGERVVARCSATVVPASRLGGLLSRAAGYLELTELYEVGFDEGRRS